MRFAALALVSACVVAGCNPSPPSGGNVFPDLTRASYRAEAIVQDPEGGTMPVVMIRSGNKMRMEMAGPMGQMAMINNGDTGESFVLVTNGGRTTAMQLSTADFETPAQDWSAEYASTARRTGSCSVAGENGSEWTHDVEGVSSTACVTNDGIILRAADNGGITWETTSVQRGPQSADLFVAPPGVQIMDMSAIAGAASAAARGAAGSPQLCDTLRDAGAPADALSRAGC
jgi:hypothetical protein